MPWNLVYGFAGFVLGIFVMALMCAASDADDDQERYERNVDWAGTDQASRLRELVEKSSLN